MKGPRVTESVGTSCRRQKRRAGARTDREKTLPTPPIRDTASGLAIHGTASTRQTPCSSTSWST